jgi:hypothetical protein
VSVINPQAKPTEFAPQLKNLEAPSPGGNNYKNFLNQQKIKSAKLYPPTHNKTDAIILGEAENPQIMDEMGMRKYIAQIDQESIYNGGTPLDNTMALSSKYLLASVNSFLWAWNLEGDSNLFVDEHGSTYTISFAEFGKDYIVDPAVESPFDPKLLYIPNQDRFIFLFLSGRKPTDSKIIVGFSSTNDPRDPWYVYKIEGNPRGVDQWSDFPMIGYDNENMYLSINLLKANTSWQLGFKGSIVWQLPLSDGFSGDSNLTVDMYDNILFKGTNIRNLTPVQNNNQDITLSKPNGEFTFLSNRNFDISNDSLFLFRIFKDQATTDFTILPKPYGMPPNGIQADDNPNIETDGLQTNDARFLGAVRYRTSQGDEFIEFVGNTKDFSTGRAAIYHGKLPVETSSLSLKSEIIGVDSLDFGYPNIVYVNNGQNCYEGTLIAFNHTSFTTPAGVSVIRHSNRDGYSDIIRLKDGDDYVRRLSGSYERWGDYFGIQSVPNHPNQVFTSGFYGTDKRSSSTWFSKLLVSDSLKMNVVIDRSFSPNFISSVTFDIEVANGYPDYLYQWSDGSTGVSNTINITEEGIHSVTITDQKGCAVTEVVSISSPGVTSNILFPNPVVDEFKVTFNLEKDTQASFVIYDMAGRQVAYLGKQTVKKGDNLFSFSARPLLKGSYVILIQDDEDNTIVRKSFVKL